MGHEPLTASYQKRHAVLIRRLAYKEGRSLGSFLRSIILGALQARGYLDIDFNLTEKGREEIARGSDNNRQSGNENLSSPPAA